MMAELKILKDSDYFLWLKELKAKIRSVQVRAALAANRELILFYWELGGDISRKLAQTNWGAKVIGRLAKDLSSEFPGIQGFSRTNLYYVKKFYDYFSTFSENEQLVPPSGGQIEIAPQTAAKTVPAIVPQIGGQKKKQGQTKNALQLISFRLNILPSTPNPHLKEVNHAQKRQIHTAIQTNRISRHIQNSLAWLSLRRY